MLNLIDQYSTKMRYEDLLKEAAHERTVRSFLSRRGRRRLKNVR